ncbi:MAG: hypothetical protein ACJ75H_16760 [Thermoanaerobaculia bacterium]
MLKKRIALAVLSLSVLSFPAASQALPLMGLPLSGVDVVTKVADWLDLGAVRAARAARPARRQRSRIKNGCSIDPNGQPICLPGTGGAGSGATSSTGDGSGE